MNQQIEDKIVLRVLARFNERSQVGITKYNTTLERTDLSTLEWLTHAQDEAMDFCLYLERLKDEYKSQKNAFIKCIDGKLIPLMEGEYVLLGGEIICVI